MWTRFQIARLGIDCWGLERVKMGARTPCASLQVECNLHKAEEATDITVIIDSDRSELKTAYASSATRAPECSA